MKTVEEKVILDEVIDTAKKWREAQHIKTPVVEEEKKRPIVVSPEDITILDKNGNEIDR